MDAEHRINRCLMLYHEPMLEMSGVWSQRLILFCIIITVLVIAFIPSMRCPRLPVSQPASERRMMHRMMKYGAKWRRLSLSQSLLFVSPVRGN